MPSLLAMVVAHECHLNISPEGGFTFLLSSQFGSLLLKLAISNSNNQQDQKHGCTLSKFVKDY